MAETVTYDSFRARVQDRDGDRWSIVGSLTFIEEHADEKNLTVLWVKPCKSDVKPGPGFYERVMVNLHRDLFPERYHDEDELERRSLRDEWDAGTIEWVAEEVERAVRGVPGIVTDPDYRPPTRQQRIESTLKGMEIGATIELGALSIERKAKDHFGVRDDGERWDETLAGAVQLIEEQEDDAVKEAIASP